jgi:NAD(P)H dehydrogenase (quinone)
MIVVTGATGQLGRLVIDALIARGTPPAGIVAAVRSPDKAADLAARGVVVREADYHRAETLEAALAGADKLLLISSSDFDDRAGQHANVVAAAKAAGVGLIAYTSILRADTSPIALAADHKATEAAIRASGLPFIFLRNGWYSANYDGASAGAAASGQMMGSAGTGRISAAAREDYAEAAAAALIAGAPNTVLELAGDSGFTMAELAAEVAATAGRAVTYTDLPEEKYRAALAGLGLPEGYAYVLAQADAQVPAGWLQDDSGTLSALIGRPTTPIRARIRALLNAPVPAE